MRHLVNAGIVAAAISLVIPTAPSHAADLMELPPEPVVEAPGHCYFRFDAGYSFNDAPDGNFNGPTTRETIDDSYLLETGVGCGTNGFRGELLLSYREERDITVIPPIDDTFTDVHTYSFMANFFYDFANYSGFVPYVGAGIGFAYHVMSDVYDDINPQVALAGDEDLVFTWALMAGVGYNVSENVVIDVGYRYIDLGGVSSERADTAFFVNPFLNLDDLTAHEIKAGIRYRFGGCCEAIAPLK